MGMDVHPSGRYQRAGGIDFAPPRPSLAARGAYHARVDCQVAAKCRFAAAVDDFAIADHEVMHEMGSCRAGLRARRYWREIYHRFAPTVIVQVSRKLSRVIDDRAGNKNLLSRRDPFLLSEQRM
jgi:hypothetical protein